MENEIAGGLMKSKIYRRVKIKDDWSAGTPDPEGTFFAVAN
jgi:hypothetical protein